MVEYLEIEEKQIPVRINRKAIVLFEKQFKKSLANIADMGTDELSRLLYLGVVEGYKFAGDKNPYKGYEGFENDLDLMELSDFYEKAGKLISSFFSSRK